MRETRVYLCLWSTEHMDFDEISLIAGVPATRICMRGEPVPSGAMEFVNGKWEFLKWKENSWEYEVPISYDMITSIQYSKLMNAINAPDKLGNYCKKHGICVKLYIVVSGVADTHDLPALGCDKNFIQFLAKLNASVTPDIYIR